jgi:hypothetical protein
LNFRLTQCPVVDAHIVNDPVKKITSATASSPNIHINRRIELGCRDRPAQRAIVQDAVNIDIQRPGGSIVDSRHMIPHIQ